jgi:hypothetical protein
MNENKLVSDRDYFVVQGWMVNKLDLRGCEKEVFAVVYGYCKTKESETSFFYGSLRYLQEFTGYGRSTIIDALKSLCSKEFIVKHSETKNNVLFNKYALNHKVIDMYLACEGEMKTNRFNHKFPSLKSKKTGGTETVLGGGTVTKPNNIELDNIENTINTNKENKNKEIFDLDFDLNISTEENDSFLLRENIKDTAQGLESIGSLGKNSPEFLFKKLDENGNILKQSNNPYKIFTKQELLIQKGFISDLTNDYYPIDETYLPIQDNAANERFRAKYPPLYPEFGNYMNIYQSCLRDFPKNEAKGQLLFEQLYPEKIQWSLVRSKKGIEPIQKEDINEDFLKDMEYSTTATLMYFGLKYEAMGKNTDKPTMKYTEIWVPIYPYSYLEKQAAPRLKAFLNTASNVPNYYKILTDLIKTKEKNNK